MTAFKQAVLKLARSNPEFKKLLAQELRSAGVEQTFPIGTILVGADYHESHSEVKFYKVVGVEPTGELFLGQMGTKRDRTGWAVVPTRGGFSNKFKRAPKMVGGKLTVPYLTRTGLQPWNGKPVNIGVDLQESEMWR